MASSIARLFFSNLGRVRSVCSFSRFFNTKGYQYDENDSQDECILKFDDKHGSLFRDVINDAFSPCHSPTGNLARLLNEAEHLIGFSPCKLPRWQVVEDDKVLYLIRAMAGSREEYVKQFSSNEGFMSEKREKDVDESLTKRGFVPEKETEGPRDLIPLLDLITGDKVAPNEYYYHLMKNAKELDPFAEYIKCRFQGKMDVSMSLRVSYDPENAQAIHILIGLGGMVTVLLTTLLEVRLLRFPYLIGTRPRVPRLITQVA